VADTALDSITIEAFSEDRHSVKDITDLLHRSYARLAQMGLNFWATVQPPEVTRKRLLDGQGLVATLGGRIVGTITFYDQFHGEECAWYQLPTVSRFGQFAVEVELQSLGIGRTLIDKVTGLARTAGKKELALDTSEQAAHLLEYYRKKGFRFVQHMQWSGVNYRSVVLSKEI
jgi:GNAT superfamily N-acetyltransferase